MAEATRLSLTNTPPAVVSAGAGPGSAAEALATRVGELVKVEAQSSGPGAAGAGMPLLVGHLREKEIPPADLPAARTIAGFYLALPPESDKLKAERHLLLDSSEEFCREPANNGHLVGLVQRGRLNDLARELNEQDVAELRYSGRFANCHNRTVLLSELFQRPCRSDAEKEQVARLVKWLCVRGEAFTPAEKHKVMIISNPIPTENGMRTAHRETLLWFIDNAREVQESWINAIDEVQTQSGTYVGCFSFLIGLCRLPNLDLEQIGQLLQRVKLTEADGKRLLGDLKSVHEGREKELAESVELSESDRAWRAEHPARRAAAEEMIRANLRKEEAKGA